MRFLDPRFSRAATRLDEVSGLVFLQAALGIMLLDADRHANQEAELLAESC